MIKQRMLERERERERETVSFSHDFFVVARKPDVVTKEQLMLAPLKKSFFEQIQL